MGKALDAAQGVSVPKFRLKYHLCRQRINQAALAGNAEFRLKVAVDAGNDCERILSRRAVFRFLVHNSASPTARRPARIPEHQAQCRLYPPHSPATSNTSPARYSPERQRD